MLPSFLPGVGQSSSESAYTKLADTEESNDIPLLPTNHSGLVDDVELRVGSHNVGRHDDMISYIHSLWQANLPKRIGLVLMGTIVAFVLVSTTWALWPERSVNETEAAKGVAQPINMTINATFIDPVARAHQKVKALFAEQSTTLAEAKSRYTLKTGHDPPNRFEEFYRYAKERKCLIDNYDQIYTDFAPFYQLAADDPTWFQKRLKHGLDLASQRNIALKGWNVKNGKGASTDKWDASYTDDWQYLLDSVCQYRNTSKAKTHLFMLFYPSSRHLI